MRRLAIIAGLALTAAACGRSGGPEITTGLAPDDAPERASLPAKCKQSRTFDDECRALFDKIWGAGAGDNESANLKIKGAYDDGNAFKKSTAEPAPELGIEAD